MTQKIKWEKELTEEDRLLFLPEFTITNVTIYELSEHDVGIKLTIECAELILSNLSYYVKDWTINHKGFSTYSRFKNCIGNKIGFIISRNLRLDDPIIMLLQHLELYLSNIGQSIIKNESGVKLNIEEYERLGY